jgi:membrane protein implicated in regulation of membrane protease activity
MRDRDLLSKFVLGAIAFCLCVVVAAILLMSDNSALKAAGAVVLLVYFAGAFVSDWVLARQNEKHVEENPHLLKNEAVGETVTARGDFEPHSGASKGLVILHGSFWKAHCFGHHVPRDGDALLVHDRDGLTLIVGPHDSIGRQADRPESGS